VHGGCFESALRSPIVTRRQRIVGIDLGTTHTVVAWVGADEATSAVPAAARICAISELVSAGEIEQRPLLPSFLYAPLPGENVADTWNDSPWVIGDYARRRGQEVPGRLISSAKSWLCHAAVDRTAAILPWGDDAEGIERISPLEASARILLHVKRAWNEAYPNHPLEDQQVVLTVPASFDQAARELTLRAARQAGLSVRLVEEPQAAFYDYLARAGLASLEPLLGSGSEALVLVCDVGGGTTDLSLIRVTRTEKHVLELTRVAVGRHLLLGGDNMDLALAHVCEARLVEPPARLEPQRFAELVQRCRVAKEQLLSDDSVDSMPINLLGSGSALVGSTLSTRLTKNEVEKVVLDGFFPVAGRDARPERRRSGILAFGLPYEQDPAITRQMASFFARHAPDAGGPRALLLNGGVFHSARIAERLLEALGSWQSPPPELLSQPDPDLAVARGAVVYGLALAGRGLRIGGGAAHGYYIGLEGRERRAVCVVPRGAKEGERHLAAGRVFALRLGQPVRFELYGSDSGPVHAPGQVVTLDDEHFEALPPLARTIETSEQGAEELAVEVEGELSAIGTLELGCVEAKPSAADTPAEPRHFRLAFELRGAEGELQPRASERPRDSLRPQSRRLDQGYEAIQRVFGKGRSDVKPRETKDLLRELERLLGERRSWTAELSRSLFDVIAPKHRARKRSADHERVYWMLAGFCLRPGWGNPLDVQRIALIAPLFSEGLTFGGEQRGWQQFFIAWRRVAGGLTDSMQRMQREHVDPFLAPRDAQLKKPKGFKPEPLFEMLELASCLERVPVERRAELGQWVVERTFTGRDPRLWAVLGRIGARVPAYASLHHVVSPRVAERWLDHLLREKWEEVPTAPHAAVQMARMTGDRARDVSDAVRREIAARLERAGARADWIRAVLEPLPVEDAERAEFFGEELPVGLRLVE
jgi:molecular chaperone DnaK (HSP70)